MIVSYSHLLQEIQKLLNTKRASSYFINGVAGSGKTYLLKKVAKCLPRDIPGARVFGPYSADNLEKFRKKFLSDLVGEFYLDDQLTEKAPEDIFSFWNWLKQHIDTSQSIKWVLIFDVDYSEVSSLDAWRPIMSNARVLEHSWADGPLKIHFILSGFWDPQALARYYRDIQTSFPYTTGYNYLALTGVSDQDIRQILVEHDISNESIAHSLGLFKEFTGGHPGVMMDVLSYLGGKPLIMENLLTATVEAVNGGLMAKSMLDFWKELPETSLEIINVLLHCRKYPYNQDLAEPLVVSGVCDLRDVWGSFYLQIKSYYVQLLLRGNVEVLGLDASVLPLDDYRTMLIPSLSYNNVLAYQMIFDIENMVRNLISIELLLLGTGEDHILDGWDARYDWNTRESLDAYDRALDWYNRSQDSVEAPLIAFLSTRDLAVLLEEISQKTEISLWTDIGKKMRDLAKIRDVVMHNQMIGGETLEQLIALQKTIFKMAEWNLV